MNELSIFLAFAAGLCSFLSPCCLPLIPSYLSFISGTSIENLKAQTEESTGITGIYKNHLIIKTASFILGFTVVFVILSILLATTFSLIGNINKYINRVAGIIVAAMGINIFFNISTKIKNIGTQKKEEEQADVCVGCETVYDKRYKTKKSPKGLVGAFLVGAAFAVGWTPCVGPVLGSILFLAGQSGSFFNAIIYLLVYSLGLGLPFLCMAIFFEKAFDYIAKTMKYKNVIQKISGILLVGIGSLIYFGQFQKLNIAIQKWQYNYIDWVSAGGLAVRLLPAGIAMFIVFFLVGIRLLHKKPVFCMKITIPTVILICAALLQTVGIIDSAGMLSRWFLSLQNL
ncbi:hypothetical protein FACS1894172_12230 [Spirochaetia bacterium]|nr:hypothetical protein FACS1894172_12230 [Spirochaetia bacterium]